MYSIVSFMILLSPRSVLIFIPWMPTFLGDDDDDLITLAVNRGR